MPYQKTGHSQVWYVTLTDADGRVHRLSTGVHDYDIACDMEDLIVALTRRGSRDWDLVRALVERDPAQPDRRRLTLARLFDADQKGELTKLRKELADVDLAPAVDAWQTKVQNEQKPETVRGYTQRIKAIAPVDENGVRLPLMRSTLTKAWIAARRDAVPGGIPSRLAYLTAWSACCEFLHERGLLSENPVRQVKWPRQPKTKTTRHIARLSDVQRFVAAFPTLETRAIAALREGVGADWDGLGPMVRADIVDPDRGLIFLPGRKTDNRERSPQVEPWAMQHVNAYLAAHPAPATARLFTISQRTYNTYHRKVVADLRAEGAPIPKGYTPHNGRHSFAVRKRRQGWPDWKIGEYLGNTAAEVASTYAHFKPQADDMLHDEAVRRSVLESSQAE